LAQGTTEIGAACMAGPASGHISTMTLARTTEMVLKLVVDGRRRVSPSDVVAALGFTPIEAASELRELARRGFVREVTGEAGEPEYEFDAATEDAARAELL
jgi:hypothetical protein